MTSRPESLRLVLAARLGELESYWLEIRCEPCGNVLHYPLKLMAERLGERHQLGAVIPRLVCKQCRAKPSVVYLCETPIREFCHGAPPGWSVQLIPPARTG